MLFQVERSVVHKTPESVISCLDLGGDPRAWNRLIQDFAKYEGDNLKEKAADGDLRRCDDTLGKNGQPVLVSTAETSLTVWGRKYCSSWKRSQRRPWISRWNG